MAFFTNLAPFLLFSAFVLLLLVTLSAPIIDPIYLFRLSADVGGSSAGGSGSVQFGVFGYCVSAIETSILGIDNTRSAECSSPRLGYRFDSTVARVLGVSGITDLISRTLTAILVLNPIATGLTFLAFLTSLFMLRKGANGTARLPSFLTLGVGFLAALLTTVAFIANIVIVAVVRNRIRNDLGDDIGLTWGNAVWMTLAATVALWLSLVGALCGICGCGHRRRRSDYAVRKGHTATY